MQTTLQLLHTCSYRLFVNMFLNNTTLQHYNNNNNKFKNVNVHGLQKHKLHVLYNKIYDFDGKNCYKHVKTTQKLNG